MSPAAGVVCEGITQVGMSSCYRCSSGLSAVLARTVIDAVARHGCFLVDMADHAASRPEVYLCDRVTDEVVDEVAHWRGQERLLVIVTSPAGLSGRHGWRLLRQGADDVVVWHDDGDGAGDLSAASVAARLRRWHEVDAILGSDLVRGHLIGRSPAWRRTLRHVIEVACFTTAPILLHGESGTGKELVARLIHTLDRRPDKGDLITVDCTTLASELIGSELFGHERGAFTGAAGARDGAFCLGHRGTILLDEIGELPLALQPQLLRVIQEGTYKRIGGNHWRPSEFRLVCATHRDLSAWAGSGHFRADLYYRIATHVIELPPLRERLDDILPLTRHFMGQHLPEGETIGITAPVREFLLGRAYPGNVRELGQLVARLCTRHVGPGALTLGDIPEQERPLLSDEPAPVDWLGPDFVRCIHQALCLGVSLKDLGRQSTDLAIRLVVDQENGNLQRAARRLGVTDRALQMRRAQGDP